MSVSMKKNEKKPNRPAYMSVYNRFFKRIIDFSLALLLLVFAIPVFIAVGILIALDDGFPVFYRPLRGGYKGKPFRIIKFRTMVKNADRIGGGTTALNDPRITKVGRFLRKSKLDETANLLNVIIGNMSFIGPRPELLQYTETYDEEERKILMVRPGVTDYSSIEFIGLDEIVGAENADEMYEKYVLKRKNELRIKYAETVSFGTDVKLFVVTVGRVIRKAFRSMKKGN